MVLVLRRGWDRAVLVIIEYGRSVGVKKSKDALVYSAYLVLREDLWDGRPRYSNELWSKLKKTPKINIIFHSLRVEMIFSSTFLTELLLRFR